MSRIRISGIAYVRFQVPDLAAIRRFLDDFGLTCVADDGSRLFSRGAQRAPFIYAAELGEPRFLALGLRAATIGDLAVLAEAEQCEIARLDAPGGGQVVVLHDPDGNRIEVVAGQSPSPLLDSLSSPAWNRAGAPARVGEPKRIGKGPSHVTRLGHCELSVRNFETSERWYKDRFGFISSDEVRLSPEIALGAFLRCDRGYAPTDHHTLLLVQDPENLGFVHAAFEVADLDDLMAGHHWLEQAGHPLVWGIGRHVLGSQVSDYWRDPWGHVLEHWTDGDLLVASDATNVATIEDLRGVQWGPRAPAPRPARSDTV
jgi:catechol 2,3-dioxygenase-like lactoylglutathione lyase family enzyme